MTEFYAIKHKPTGLYLAIEPPGDETLSEYPLLMNKNSIKTIVSSDVEVYDDDGNEHTLTEDNTEIVKFVEVEQK